MLYAFRLCFLLGDCSPSFFIRKMEDQYVVLVERVVTENVRLREELEACDNEQKRILAELGAKTESSANSRQE